MFNIGDKVELNSKGILMRVDEMKGWVGNVVGYAGHEKYVIAWNPCKKCGASKKRWIEDENFIRKKD